MKPVQPPLPSFEGEVVKRGDPGYEKARIQYATTSHEEDYGHMDPAAIIYPKGDADILKAIAYAREHKLAIAIRTGGHQYSGASSTSGKNIQLDLSHTYKEYEFDKEASIVTTGVSRMLGSLNRKLFKEDVFVPHGQCAHVHVGGHSHTGGYGVPGRAFGLFGDHIIAIRTITADGRIRWIERDTTDSDEADLFYATLGGSPGNFGILTHIKLKVHKREDHPDAIGLNIVVPYNKSACQKLLQHIADSAAKDDLPGDFDFCLTVISNVPFRPEQPLVDDGVSGPAPRAVMFKAAAPGHGGAKEEEVDMTSALRSYGYSPEEIREFEEACAAAAPGHAPAAAAARGKSILPFTFRALIIIWAEWANLEGKGQAYDPTFLDNLKDAVKHLPGLKGDKREIVGQGMPFLTGNWVFPIQREFYDPYNKRTYVTNRTDLHTNGWVEFTAQQIDSYVDRWINGARISAQIFNYGGSKSAFRNKDPENKSSYSWRRDTTVVAVLDAFYKPFNLIGSTPKEDAEKWQRENDEGYKGARGNFSPGFDRRVFWGSYGATADEYDLEKSWAFYHETPEKWARLKAIKQQVDPENIFSSNPFSIRA